MSEDAAPVTVDSEPKKIEVKGEAKKEEPKEKGPKKEKVKKEGGGKGKGKGKGKEGGAKGKREFNGPTGSGGYRLNVKNLSNETTTKEQLTALFAPFGTVQSAEVKQREEGGSRGFGYVILANEEEGKAAIDAMNGKTIGGKALNVAPAERRIVEDDGKGKGKGGKDPMADMYQMQMAMAMQQQAAFMAMMGGYGGMPGMPGMPPMGMPGIDPLGTLGFNAAATTGEYVGSIKSVNASNGYGFISCPETHGMYNRDVFIHKTLLLPGAKAGDRLRFTISVDEKGHPKAATAVPA